MKKLAMTAGFALAMGMSAAAMAHPTNSGYVKTLYGATTSANAGTQVFGTKTTLQLKAAMVMLHLLLLLQHQLRLQLQLQCLQQ
jgi:hypothetical protein